MATVKFIQAQKFSLAGSGASIGDTTIVLQSFAQINGTLLTTTDLGIKAYGTLEPGNGTQEEQISFTGVTQNSNGTATLTGVKTVGFVSPYTETSGLATTHAGATTFILSNDAGFYGQILSYVDTALSSGAIPATTLVNGIVTLSTSPASAAQPVVVGTNDPRMSTQTEKNYLASVVNTGIPYVVATGTATALTGTLASSISSLASGTSFNVLIPLTIASGVTLNINALGAKTIKKIGTATLASGDLIAGQEASMVYDGTNMQLTSPTASSFLGVVNSGQTTQDISSTTTKTIAHGLNTIPRAVNIDAYVQSSGSTAMSIAKATLTSNATVTSTISIFADQGTATAGGVTATFVLYGNVTSSQFTTGTVTMDATNISITWVKTSTPTGTAQIIWSAIA